MACCRGITGKLRIDEKRTLIRLLNFGDEAHVEQKRGGSKEEHKMALAIVALLCYMTGMAG
ncbi:MAG: hypothetical protein DID90_2727552351 [Candidatus Nitrotoga sp. LAW]|nr:MAG: hypothetical protein DID90_2727552351 [Candidatus Nitrotoga sp. LAW]